MSSYLIGGVSVNFPFPPYDVQTAYMEKVIECLEGRKNGMLESPTGTGKTLSLLCSSLGWLSVQKAAFDAAAFKKKQEFAQHAKTANEDELTELLNKFKTNKNDGVSKIIYASRTHSQISQAIQELKRSGYGHMRAAVIGSRDQLCINSEVQKEPSNAAKTAACKAKIQSKSCTYHLRLEKGRTSKEFTEPPILDIEDLVKIGEKVKACPFFVSKDQVENADIVFMPYNYLLDPKTRSTNGIELYNTIVILDEAHNVENLCEESSSVELRSSDIATAITDVTAAMKHMDDLEKHGGSIEIDDKAKDFSIDDLATLKEMLLRLEQEIDGIHVENKAEGQTYNGNYIFDILEAAKFQVGNHKVIVKLVDSLVQFLTVISETTAFGKKGFGLQKLNDLLTIVFADRDEDYHARIMRCYRVHVQIEESQSSKSAKEKDKDGWYSRKMNTTTTTTQGKVVNYWCFSPNFSMRQLLEKNTRSIILTSGTLAPMAPLISEMGIPVGVQLENPHIVKSDQVLVQIVSQGPDKEPLVSNFQNRNNPKYLQSLGRTILSFCPLVPDGLLVFFPSYPIMDVCQKAWQESGVWAQIQRLKPIFVEPRGKTAFVNTMTEYYEQIKRRRGGAVFMAVCRGKVSEGLDFANENGRGVIITGLPFPPLKDPRVILKKRYLEDNRRKDSSLLSGDEWYVLEAARAVNQAIGRVIRHRFDYGAILLCDGRFANPRQQSQLSKWIQGHLRAMDMRNVGTFGKHIGDINRFFKNAEKNAPRVKAEGCSQGQGEDGEQKRPSNVIETFANDDKPKFHDLIGSAGGAKVKSETCVDLTDSPAKQPQVKRTKSLLDSYGAEEEKGKRSEVKPGDFLSSLSSSSRVIDFNSKASVNTLSQVKAEESSQSRKRKYRLVDNEPAKVLTPKPSFSSTANGETETETETLPQDKAELIKVIKSKLTKEDYRRLLNALKGYQSDSQVSTLYQEMSSVFHKPEHHYMLRGMKRFVKDSQHKEFESLLGK